jgi:hypothetical protein
VVVAHEPDGAAGHVATAGNVGGGEVQADLAELALVGRVSDAGPGDHVQATWLRHGGRPLSGFRVGS